MKKIYIVSLLIMLITAASSCKKEGTLHANLDAIDRNQSAKTDLDRWIDENFVVPYNIEVKYRWDAFELNLSKDMTPPLESQVIPAMQTVKDVWISTYESVGGKDFMKINAPKQFVLVGSPEFNGDGTITLGTAEGGRKIVLYVINNFDKSNTQNVKQMIQVIQHEFTHILNQKVAFDPAFSLVTKADYTANWNIPSLDDARALGFITQYSRSNPIEDFAEMVANMLMMGSYEYNNIVNALPLDPRTKLRKKEQLVVEYFKTAWGIDFYALQQAVTDAVENTAPVILANSIGPGNTYTTFASSPLTETPQSAEFLANWNTAKTALGNMGFVLTKYDMTFKANHIMTLRYYFTSGDGSTTYYGDTDYFMDFDPNTTGLVKLEPLSVQPTDVTYANMAFIKNAMTAVDNYIKNNQFRFDWAPNLVPGSKGAKGAFGAFYKVDDASSYMIGTLN
ncbi:putative zinc-binding metallopeptidase [Mucilaginibacter litoreus]|uniref:Zinc-binding metallopeptidase n=1 Tax=Mucilaginibacter litoreus TaxID=1048221 RepID=A0ABW3AMQ2_9SPHI